MTTVCENARLELLRALAAFRDWLGWYRAENADLDFLANGFCPLWEGEWENDDADIQLAAKEAAALGQVELCGGAFNEPMVKITGDGYDWIKARDVIGEAEQEMLMEARP